MKKPDNVVKINTTLQDLFKYWLLFLRPLNNLTDGEIEIAASLLRYRRMLSKSITDDNLLDEVLFSLETKKKLIKEHNISYKHFLVVFTSLKKKKIIIDNRINPKFIPNIEGDNPDNFKLLLLFDIK